MFLPSASVACREVETAGRLLQEQDGRLQALLVASGPSAHQSMFRAAAVMQAASGLLTAVAFLSQLAEFEEHWSSADALLGAACLLTSSGRLALAAAGQHGSSAPADLRLHLLISHIQAAGAATTICGREGAPAAPLATLLKAFSSGDTAEWLQLVTGGLMSLCMGGPLAASIKAGKCGFNCK